MIFSIVVPLYRGKKFIDSIILMAERNKSRLEELFHDVKMEIIFVNDFPSDNNSIKNVNYDSLDVCFLKHTQNQGIHKSRIDGLNYATGDYILFLDQDDEISDEYLLSQVSELLETNAGWSICNGYYRGDKLIYNDENASNKALDEDYYFGSLIDIISPGQVLLKKSVIPNSWKEHILIHNYCDDAFLWMLLKDGKIPAVYNQKTLYRHNEDGGNTSFSWKKNADALRELRDVIVSAHMLSDEHINSFLKGVEKEINKQDTYSLLEEDFNSEEFSNRLIGLIDNDDSVIIYGFGYWGRKLFALLSCLGISVNEIVDKAASGYQGSVSVSDPGCLMNLSAEQKDKSRIFIAIPMEGDYIRHDLMSYGYNKLHLINEI